MNENDIARVVVDCCYHIHKKIGPGLFESVYEEILAYELSRRDLKCNRQVGIPTMYDHLVIDVAFRADLIVSQLVIVELKSIESVLPLHKKQLLTYLKLTGLKLGLLVNFNVDLIKNGITRIVNRL